MKSIITSIVILLANVTLSQTKNVLTICDSTKKHVSAKLNDTNGRFRIFLGIEFKGEEYTFNIAIPQDNWSDYVISKGISFYFTMENDSVLKYIIEEEAYPDWNSERLRSEYIIILKGDYKDELWQILTRKRIKSIGDIVNYKDFLINPEESKKLLAELKCYATTLK
jgi:hypothetical protein